MKNINKNEYFSILVVDDTPANLDVLNEMLAKEGYDIRLVTSGKAALRVVQNLIPDLIILDINMPEMNGYEVCKKLKEDNYLKEIPVIFISALNETLDKVKAFSIGGVDYVTKPFQYEEVQARVKTHLKIHQLQTELEKHNEHLEELVKEQVKEIYESQMATIFALAKLSESRDNDTGKHLERVQYICRLISTELSYNTKYKDIITPDYIENIFYACPLHDIGKVGIKDDILLKPGKFTPEEFEYMKTHSVLGAETLEAVHKSYPNNTFINMGIDIARYHHERWDGSGYPDGLSGDNIPLCARIMSIADVYDAVRSKRCYKSSHSHEETSEIIIKESDNQFDPDIIESYKEIQEELKDIWDKII
jgi:putative two-component system response regulator